MATKRKKSKIRFDRLFFLILVIALILFGFYKLFVEKPVDEENNNPGAGEVGENIASKFESCTEYKAEKLDDYLNFYDKNQDIELENIIKLVNKDIDKLEDFT